MSEAEAKKAEKAPERSLDELEAELKATRERLVATVAEIRERANPQKVKAQAEKKVREVYYSDSGVRWDRVAYTAAAVGAGMFALNLLNKAVGWVFSFPHRDEPDVVYIPVLRAQLEALKVPADIAED